MKTHSTSLSTREISHKSEMPFYTHHIGKHWKMWQYHVLAKGRENITLFQAVFNITLETNLASSSQVENVHMLYPESLLLGVYPGENLAWKEKYKNMLKASLVVQWLGICLPMQGTRVWALVWEDPTCRGATGPVSHNYWACASGACAPQQERPR